MPEETSEIMTTDQVAKYLKCSSVTIYRMVQRNAIPFFKIGTGYRFHKTAIDEWALSASVENNNS